jgi:hypothetical protein
LRQRGVAVLIHSELGERAVTRNPASAIRGAPSLGGTVEFDSSVITEQAKPQLNEIADALRNAALKGTLTAGFGKRVPKIKADPYAPENRRVQLANMASTTETSR